MSVVWMWASQKVMCSSGCVKHHLDRVRSGIRVRIKLIVFLWSSCWRKRFSLEKLVYRASEHHCLVEVLSYSMVFVLVISSHGCDRFPVCDRKVRIYEYAFTQSVSDARVVTWEWASLYETWRKH